MSSITATRGNATRGVAQHASALFNELTEIRADTRPPSPGSPRLTLRKADAIKKRVSQEPSPALSFARSFMSAGYFEDAKRLLDYARMSQLDRATAYAELGKNMIRTASTDPIAFDAKLNAAGIESLDESLGHCLDPKIGLALFEAVFNHLCHAQFGDSLHCMEVEDRARAALGFGRLSPENHELLHTALGLFGCASKADAERVLGLVKTFITQDCDTESLNSARMFTTRIFGKQKPGLASFSRPDLWSNGVDFHCKVLAWSERAKSRDLKCQKNWLQRAADLTSSSLEALAPRRAGGIRSRDYTTIKDS